MEELKNLNVEDQVAQTVEVVAEKLTFKENCEAYVLAGIFATGLATIGYVGYKGIRKLVKTIGDKKKIEAEAEMEKSLIGPSNDEDDDDDKDDDDTEK